MIYVIIFVIVLALFDMLVPKRHKLVVTLVFVLLGAALGAAFGGFIGGTIGAVLAFAWLGAVFLGAMAAS